MKPLGLALCLAVLLSACEQTPTPPVELPPPTSWTASPPRLALAVGEVATVTDTVFNGSHALGPTEMDGWWVEVWQAGCFQCLDVRPLDVDKTNPQRFQVQALAAGADTLIFHIFRRQCPPGGDPDCYGAYGVDILTPLSVPVLVDSGN